jgi:hypothetical protein
MAITKADGDNDDSYRDGIDDDDRLEAPPPPSLPSPP